MRISHDLPLTTPVRERTLRARSGGASLLTHPPRLPERPVSPLLFLLTSLCFAVLALLVGTTLATGELPRLPRPAALTAALATLRPRTLLAALRARLRAIPTRIQLRRAAAPALPALQRHCRTASEDARGAALLAPLLARRDHHLRIFALSAVPLIAAAVPLTPFAVMIHPSLAILLALIITSFLAGLFLAIRDRERPEDLQRLRLACRLVRRSGLRLPAFALCDERFLTAGLTVLAENTARSLASEHALDPEAIIEVALVLAEEFDGDLDACLRLSAEALADPATPRPRPTRLHPTRLRRRAASTRSYELAASRAAAFVASRPRAAAA